MASNWWQLAKAVPKYVSYKLAKAKKAYPMVTARVSRDEGGSYSETMSRFMDDFSGLAAKYPFEVLDAVDSIFMFEPYQAKFLHTTLALGNTGHKLEIGAGTEARAKQALEVANAFAARCFPWSGGMDGAINGFFCQVARTGAICGEAAPDESLTDLSRIYLPPIRSIRFRYKKKGEVELCQRQEGKLVPLNPVQTVYHCAVPWDNSPYGMPPVLSALRSAAKLQKFDKSIDGWLNKLSALGVFLAEIEPPPQGNDEPQELYDGKAGEYLNKIAKTIRDNLQQGFAATYNNVEMKFQNTTAGAAGAKDLLQMVLQGLFAGLQRDPVFFGHNFNTTETFAKVVFEELLGGIMNFQLGVKRAVEHFLRLLLALNGFGDVTVSMRFNPNRSLDWFMQSEGDKMQSDKVISELNAGILDREEARQILGYDDADASAGGFVASLNRAQNVYCMQPYRRKYWKGADLSNTDTDRLTIELELQNSARDAREAAKKYVWEIQRELSEAARIGVEAVYEWARVRDIPEEDVFVREVLQMLIDQAEGSLDAATLEAIAKEHLTTIWKWARYEDDALFAGWDRSSRNLPVNFDGPDYAGIGYLKRVDRFYVSKFVSGDEAQSRKISDFLREQYLDRGLGRGKSPKELRRFADEFGDLVERIGDHRARVIIDTGVSRCQNWGEMFALHDEQITTFRIAGPWDNVTCKWCKALQGKEFEVATEIERIENIILSGDEEIGKFDKFIPSRFGGKKGLEELQSLDAAAIQATGMVTPPIHPLCRHRLIAVIEMITRNMRTLRNIEAISLIDRQLPRAA